jgi:hypothetical protein
MAMAIEASLLGRLGREWGNGWLARSREIGVRF